MNVLEVLEVQPGNGGVYPTEVTLSVGHRAVREIIVSALKWCRLEM